MDDAARLAAADRVRVAYDVQLPELRYWNYDPCIAHEEVTPGCNQCGVHFRRHQRVGIAWAYLAKRGLLADSVGTGKTIHAAGLLAMLKEKGELDEARSVVVLRPQAIFQWQLQLQRMVPKLFVELAVGERRDRIDRYLGPWDTMLIGYQMLLRDIETLMHFPLAQLIIDDVDALRNRDNRTAWAIKRLARDADRCLIMTGTPLQKKLHELHSVTEPIGGRELFGPEVAFLRRYVRQEQITIYDQRKGKKRTAKKVVGYKNVDEFKRLIAPIALRRTAADIDDVDLPTIVSQNVTLELYPEQRERYKDLQKGVLKIIREEGTKIKQATAMAKLVYGAQICDGLATIGENDGPAASTKLDWTMDKLTGDLSDEKVVVFSVFKNTIRAAQKRMSDEGIDYETIWGDEPDKMVRHQSVQRFWNDSRCKVLIGTTALEQSLDLQVARHLINIGMILNPARMEQLSGRIRRDGSAFNTVYIHNLLCEDTQEDRYLPLLQREQALIDYVWGEASELFEALPPLALMQLITG